MIACWHYLRGPGCWACGQDIPNDMATETLADVTCPACLRAEIAQLTRIASMVGGSPPPGLITWADLQRKWADKLAEKDAEIASNDAELVNARATIARLRKDNDEFAKLQAFKDWVHAYLDGKGIPAHPGGPHSKEGCRIGDRMDLVFAENAALKDDLVRLRAVCATNEALLVSTNAREDEMRADLTRVRAKVRALVEEVENETAIPWAHIKTWAAVKAEGEAKL